MTPPQMLQHQPNEEELAQAIQELIGENLEYGVKRVLAHLRDAKGWLVSEKRVRSFIKTARAAPMECTVGKRPGSGGASTSTSTGPTRWMVGPDYVQSVLFFYHDYASMVLRGQLDGREVALILCGEAHEDAIDVTRAGGHFLPQEGWVGCTKMEAVASLRTLFSTGRAVRPSFVVRLAKQKCNISKGHAREWARDLFDQDRYEDLINDSTLRLFLVFLDRGKKGDAFVMIFAVKDTRGAQEDIVDIANASVAAIAHALLSSLDRSPEEESSGRDDPDELFARIHLAEWMDLDSEARQVNRRRLREARIDGTHDSPKLSDAEYDALIEKRKADRQEENMITFDAWFDEARAQAARENVATHLILEAPICPWEVELHRKDEHDRICPAPACIRCASSDSDESATDEHDPSSDGMGYYGDFVYRKMMRQQVADLEAGHYSEEGDDHENSATRHVQDVHAKCWLHCVDLRDLGDRVLTKDKATGSQGVLRDQWEQLLSSGDLRTFQQEKAMPALEWLNCFNGNPEVREAQGLMSDNSSLREDNMHSSVIPKAKIDGLQGFGSEHVCSDDGTFVLSLPSFESFFSQCSDVLYYMPHVKFLYAPFLATAVKSLDRWEQFFTALFMGGSVDEAVEMLDLQSSGRRSPPDCPEHPQPVITTCMHIRSPIHSEWSEGADKLDHARRRNDECCGHLSHYVLPLSTYLKARQSSKMPDTSPPRTWSSALFHSMHSKKERLAMAVRTWTLRSIHDKARDPKGADDPEGGGEWFVAWMRAVHRDIYDDIDHSDCGKLLRSKWAASLGSSTGKKYDLSNMTMPSCELGFQDIAAVSLDRPVPARAEVLAKILIDIHMSQIVDFATVLKILELVTMLPSHTSRDDLKSMGETSMCQSSSSGEARCMCIHDGEGCSVEDPRPVVVVCYMGGMHTKAVEDFFCGEGAHLGGFTPFRRERFLGKYEWDAEDARTIAMPCDMWGLAQLFAR